MVVGSRVGKDEDRFVAVARGVLDIESADLAQDIDGEDGQGHQRISPGLKEDTGNRVQQIGRVPTRYIGSLSMKKSERGTLIGCRMGRPCGEVECETCVVCAVPAVSGAEEDKRVGREGDRNVPPTIADRHGRVSPGEFRNA